MQLGKSLVGAIIGGALGIVLLWFVQHHHGWDDYWMALPVALLTGLGVRFAAKVKGHPSYLRGALTGILSIAMFILGQYVVAQVVTRGAAAKQISAQEPPQGPAADEAGSAEENSEASADGAQAPPAQEDESAQAAADEQTEDQPQPATNDEPADATEGTGAGSVQARVPLAKQWTTMDLLWLCIAALIGYSLGRGSDAKPGEAANSPDNYAPDRSMPPSD
jgi:hypothetical protein